MYSSQIGRINSGGSRPHSIRPAPTLSGLAHEVYQVVHIGHDRRPAFDHDALRFQGLARLQHQQVRQRIGLEAFQRAPGGIRTTLYICQHIGNSTAARNAGDNAISQLTR